MKTPITDKYKGRWATHFPEGVTIYDTARRLEQDREIFRQALIKIYTSPLTEASETILQAFREARAFPGEMHEP